MIVDTSYFYGSLSIAQITTAAVKTSVEYYINELEPKFLLELMGYELYSAYKTGIAAGSPEQKWLDIRDGKEYTNDSGRLVKWPGLKVTVVTDQYKSPIANYVYFHFMRNAATATTGTGEKSLKAQNGEDTTARMKVVRAWNEMVEHNWQLVDFLQFYDDVYPEYEDYHGDWRQIDLLTKVNPFF